MRVCVCILCVRICMRMRVRVRVCVRMHLCMYAYVYIDNPPFDFWESPGTSVHYTEYPSPKSCRPQDRSYFSLGAADASCRRNF